MEKDWILLQSIPVAGKKILLEDQRIWLSHLEEFGLHCRIVEPVTAEITILPQAEGVLFRGRIRGTVALPCDRCANDSIVVLNHAFDSFEAFPVEVLSGAHVHVDETLFGEVDAAVIRNTAHGGGVEINPAALTWEEFSLALPVKPLCNDACKGLCPLCGANKNTEGCSCRIEDGDSRMAALRGLTINRK